MEKRIVDTRPKDQSFRTQSEALAAAWKDARILKEITETQGYILGRSYGEDGEEGEEGKNGEKKIFPRIYLSDIELPVTKSEKTRIVAIQIHFNGHPKLKCYKAHIHVRPVINSNGTNMVDDNGKFQSLVAEHYYYGSD